MCFFGKQHPKNVSDIGHFEDLKFEDQEKIRQQIGKIILILFINISLLLKQSEHHYTRNFCKIYLIF